VIRAKIVGVGAYAPERILTNHELEKTLETSDAWIVERTGVRERRIAGADEVTSDLAAHAARQALARAEVQPEEVDLIVCATTSPDMLFPSTAIFCQQKIGAKRAAAFDLFATCSGSLYALSVATQYIRSGQAQTVLAVGAEILSRITDFTDRGTCIILADGAGAALLRPSTDASEILDIQLGSDGQYWDYLYCAAGGTKHPISHEVVNEKLHYIKMKGNEVFKVAVRTLENVTAALLEKHGIVPRDIDLFIPHQANLRIIRAAAKRLGMPMDKVFVNIDRYGNTGAASIYIALEEAVAQGRLKRGDLVLMAAFGGGFTWGAGLLRW